MALVSTTLAADLGESDLTMYVTSGASGFPAVGVVGVSYPVRIDGEYMVATGQPIAGVITLRSRGDQGTRAVSHDILANVLVSAQPSDFPPIPSGNVNEIPPSEPLQQTLGEDYTFTAAEIAQWSQRARTYVITKGSACLFTLVAPTKAQDGLILRFTSQTAYAHVLTATTLLGDGASGSPHTTGTFAAYVGAGLTLQANNGIWNVVANIAVTIT